MRNSKIDRAKTIIAESIAAVALSDSPDTLRPMIAGEINMASKLGLISYAERGQLMNAAVSACIKRREELHRANLERMRAAK